VKKHTRHYLAKNDNISEHGHDITEISGKNTILNDKKLDSQRSVYLKFKGKNTNESLSKQGQEQVNV
jgi:hypothetical protein